MNREIFIAGTPDDLAREAARRFVEAAADARAQHGRFSVALSGGTGPRKLFELLAVAPYCHAVDWQSVHVFFADERFVPHDNQDSNMLLASQTLLNHVSIPAANIHPMPFSLSGPEDCASHYTKTLQLFFGDSKPEFDLILLGMGPDGHTASLFPGRPDYDGWVAAVHESPKPPPTRLTLTLNLINQARRIIFLVSGADKENMVSRIFISGEAGEPLPAANVIARQGSTEWLVDRAAGASLIEAGILDDGGSI